MPESVYIRGEGGRILKHDLPLPEAIQARLDAQVIFLVDPPADEAPAAEPEPSPKPATKRTGRKAASSE